MWNDRERSSITERERGREGGRVREREGGREGGRERERGHWTRRSPVISGNISGDLVTGDVSGSDEGRG
jgi:hypothetical protein